MKKLLVVLMSLVVLTGCFHRLKSYQEIEFSQLEKMFDKKESFVLFIGSSDCSHCQSYKPKLEAFIKVNQVKVYYIDISKLNNKDYEKLETYAPFAGTPYTVFIEKGKTKKIEGRVCAIEGDRDIEYIEKIFKRNGYK